ncbi:hypothetical protein AXX12_05415 [Anaerosporomusa subterranea]|uniref:YtxH domain-containing protein n=1 Tax=Anaerosporomusa subterranea TaxID=1794912 RepID=A0A154BU83_ANASB|nr:hypothetical protein [Anaerosporomusa subterranea]KYZ77546.1 hypothetical protein AXX12_05415 [Anaerosporomusa subterranea]
MNFWRGLVWGGVVGSMIGAVMVPMMRRHRKPLIERGVDAVRESFMGSTQDLMKEARRTRKRLMKNFR